MTDKQMKKNIASGVCAYKQSRSPCFRCGGEGGGLGMDSALHFIQPNISFNVLYPNVYTMMLCLQLLTITKCNVI